MKTFYFRQKRDKLEDKRLKDRRLPEFTIEAETQEMAIKKSSSGSRVATKATVQDVIPMKLSEEDIIDLYDICDYNYAVHGKVDRLRMGDQDNES